jgi:glycosyltransferase involved in cell wall biosynthesis
VGDAWREECVRILRGCDAVLLSDRGPSLAGDIDRPVVALLTGSDVIHMADSTGPFPGELVARQRAGIANAAVVTHFARGLVPEGDRVLDGLGVPDSRRLMLLMTEPDRIAHVPPPRNARIRTFCAARLNWKRPIPADMAELDYKGSDVMVRGLGLFVRESGTPLDIRLVRKGRHVPETAELVRAEGLEGMVTWLEEMSQQDVAREFAHADIVFDQLGESVVAMAGLDAMATGRPLIANARPEIAQQGSPICQASTPREVAAQLDRLVFDAALRERVGRAGREYVESHFSADVAAGRLLEAMRRAGIAAR